MAVTFEDAQKHGYVPSSPSIKPAPKETSHEHDNHYADSTPDNLALVDGFAIFLLAFNIVSIALTLM